MAQSENQETYECKDLDIIGDDIYDGNIPSHRRGHTDDRNRRQQPRNYANVQEVELNVLGYDRLLDECFANDKKKNRIDEGLPYDYYSEQALQLQIVEDQSITQIVFDAKNNNKKSTPAFIPAAQKPPLLDIHPIRTDTIHNIPNGGAVVDDALENFMRCGIESLLLNLDPNRLIAWKRDKEINLWHFSKQEENKLKFRRQLEEANFGLSSRHADSLWVYIFERMYLYLNRNIIGLVVSRWNEIYLIFERNKQKKATKTRCISFIPQVINPVENVHVQLTKAKILDKQRGVHVGNTDSHKNQSKVTNKLGGSDTAENKSKSLNCKMIKPANKKEKKAKTFEQRVDTRSEKKFASGKTQKKATKTHCFGFNPQIIYSVENAPYSPSNCKQLAKAKTKRPVPGCSKKVRSRRGKKPSVVIEANKSLNEIINRHKVGGNDIAGTTNNLSAIHPKKAKKKAKTAVIPARCTALESGVIVCRKSASVEQKVKQKKVNKQNNGNKKQTESSKAGNKSTSLNCKIHKCKMVRNKRNKSMIKPAIYKSKKEKRARGLILRGEENRNFDISDDDKQSTTTKKSVSGKTEKKPTETDCFGFKSFNPKIIDEVQNAQMAKNAPLPPYSPSKQFANAQRGKKPNYRSIDNKVTNNVHLNKAKKKAKYKVENGVVVCNKSKYSRIKQEKKILVRSVVIVRGFYGSGNEYWANTFALRDGNAVVCIDKYRNYKQQFIKIVEATDKRVFLVIHHPLIAGYEDLIQYLVEKNIKWRMIEIFYDKSLINLFRLRSTINVDIYYYEKLPTKWQRDGRAVLMYASPYDKLVHEGSDYGSQNGIWPKWYT